MDNILYESFKLKFGNYKYLSVLRDFNYYFSKKYYNINYY